MTGVRGAEASVVRRSSEFRPGCRTLAVVESVALALVLSLTYPDRFDRRGVIWQYFHGVYRARVLGRELVVAIGDGVDALRLPIGFLRQYPHGLLPGFIVVNTGSFLVAALLLYRATNRPELRPLFVITLAALAASATVATPYDCVSYALMVALFVYALKDGGAAVAAASVLVVLAMCTRESTFVAIAAVIVARIPRGAGNGVRARASGTLRAPSVVAIAALGLLAYVVLHLLLSEGGSIVLYQHVTHRIRASTVIGLSISAASIVAVRAACRHVGDVREVRARRRLLWAMSSPYLVVCVIGGLWQEAPRLLMPVVLAEALLVASLATADAGAPGRVQDMAPPPAPVACLETEAAV